MKRLFISASMLLFSTVAFAIDLGIVEVDTQLSGQPIKLPISVNLEINTVANGVKVDVTTKTNLSDLQAKFFTILQTAPLPRDNCPSYGNHVLPYLESASLQGSGHQAVFSLIGHADGWTCQKNPIPETVCTSYKEVCFIKCFKVCEKLTTRDGSPIKAKISEGFNASVPFTLSTIDGKSIQINPGAASVNPRGDLGKFLNGLAGIFKTDLSSLASNKLSDIADKGLLRQAFPPGYESLDPQITNASFSSDTSGVLFVDTSLTATVPPEKLSEFLKEALKKK